MQRRPSTLDMSQYFDEFFDRSLGHKRARVRCQSCGCVRVKNATQQAEHLIQCKEFLSATKGSKLVTSRSLALNKQQDRNPAIWNGARINSDVPVIRPRSPGRRPSLPQTPRLAEAPSLARHLVLQAEDLLTQATQHNFLSHAGCGSLTENALNQWLAQIGHISRSLVSFTGALIGKIRIPETANLERDSTFRCLDLLCSAVYNMKKELEFLEATKRKYGLDVKFDEPNQPTKGFIDLFNSASCPSATLLEGMVMLWAIEMLLYKSFSYAGKFVTRTMGATQQNPLKSYFLPSGAPANTYGDQVKPKKGHTTALHEAFIKNWESENFGCFVNACKTIVDELAMAQTTGNGQAEMLACERVFKQAAWLWCQIFPEATGMAEQDEMDDGHNSRDSRDNSLIKGNSLADDGDSHASAGLTLSGILDLDLLLEPSETSQERTMGARQHEVAESSWWGPGILEDFTTSTEEAKERYMGEIDCHFSSV